MNATRMKVALDTIAKENDGRPGHVAARALDGINDDALARMDWAVALTDEDIDHLKKGLVLLQHAAEAFRQPAAERAISRLADELEALP